MRQCELKENVLRFRYKEDFKSSQSNKCMDEPIAIPKLRAEAKDVAAFDKALEKHFNLFTKQPETDYPDGEKS